MPPRQPSFKLAAIEELKRCLTLNIPLLFSWTCLYCHKNHTGNLLKRVRGVSSAPDCAQMIRLTAEGDDLFGVIAISKNKKLNQELADKYRVLGAVYIQVSPPSEAENVSDSLSNPSYVNTCFNPTCKTCGCFQRKRSLFIIDSFCWKCNGLMKVAVMDCDGYHLGPDRFSEEEISLARSKGAILQNNHSKTVRDSYMSNTCPRCSALTGDHYLFTDHYTEAIYGRLRYEQIPQGYHCYDCNEFELVSDEQD